MFFLGHLGIGSRIVRPWTRKLPIKAVLLGTVLPDLIDKPLYYGLSFITGKKGEALGLISGSRTFGHTALFALILAGVSYLRKSKVLAALALGVASHLLLDSLSDLWPHFPLDLMPDLPTGTDTPGSALLWPFTGWQFPAMLYKNLGEHLSFWNRPALVFGEILGALILYWDFWKNRKTNH